VKNVKIKSITTVILPVVSYGHESWSLALRREPRLRLFENKVLRKLFRPKRVDGTRGGGGGGGRTARGGG
jgi:hypothetical protein